MNAEQNYTVTLEQTHEDMIMSTQVERPPNVSVTDQLPSQPKRRCCNPRYRSRRVSSKGAMLVLAWVLLVNAAYGSLGDHTQFTVLIINSANHFSDPYQYARFALPILVWFVFALISGWLTDARWGNYKTAKLGTILLFTATVLECLTEVAMNGLLQLSASPYYKIIQTITKCLKYSGSATVLVSSIQLGLDQMPYASAANITSFISWYVLCLYTGMWTNKAISDILRNCFDQHYSTILFLFPVLCMVILLCSDFFLTPKWLIIEPNTPQSFKVIFNVLRYAKKHKAPVNRSAFTYWEEDIPSRIDLGKSKYGGPFTIEQVEDVKTILRMAAMSIPIPIILSSFYLYQFDFKYYKLAESESNMYTYNLTRCPLTAMENVVSNPLWWVIFDILIYEFAIYPLVMAWVPSILKRLGIGSLIIIVLNALYLILSGVSYRYSDNVSVNRLWIELPQSVAVALVTIILITSVLEFICAQSPQNMKGLVIAYIWCIYSFSSIFVSAIFAIFVTYCSSYCVIVYCSIATSMSIAGFITYCFLASWYKRRIREDNHSPHRWVEEAYGRYLHHNN